MQWPTVRSIFQYGARLIQSRATQPESAGKEAAKRVMTSARRVSSTRPPRSRMSWEEFPALVARRVMASSAPMIQSTPVRYRRFRE